MPRTAPPTIDIRRAGQRFETRIDWLESYHSFSFSRHYDEKNTHHGLLLVSNDDIIQANTGFSTHPHRDMEIVTWVLRGELEHKDSEGNIGLIYPGLAQRMSAGTGILHSEINASKKDEEVHLVQMWVVPDTAKIRPGYEQRDINSELAKGGLVPVASGKHDAAIPIRQAGATLWAGRLKAGESIALPESPYGHLYVALGDVAGEPLGTLGRGDAARFASAGSLRVTAGQEGAEVLFWEMDGELQYR
jgi:redox-sensitive bicupin YhaK (pirin superfamily)